MWGEEVLVLDLLATLADGTSAAVVCCQWPLWHVSVYKCLLQYSTGDLPPGTVVKQRYTIQEVLGRGSNAVTYLGKDNSTGHQVMLTRQQQPPRQHSNLHITLSTTVLSSPGGIFKPIIPVYRLLYSAHQVVYTNPLALSITTSTAVGCRA